MGILRIIQWLKAGDCSGEGIEANDTILNIYMLNQSIPLDQGPIILGLQIKSGVIMAFALNYIGMRLRLQL